MMSYEDYNAGRKGLGPTESDSGTFDYINGVKDRLASEQTTLSGEEHPQAIQLIILILGFAITFALLWKVGILPFEIWHVILMYGATLFSTIWFLRKIPQWLSGTIMAVLLGGLAAYTGWTQADLYWAAGSGLVVGGLMFRLYSRFD
ncbi:MAG: hypothetical protein OQL20_05225 [Sedimenticola sp.]|nr:hypothetical protein [Sedimenticola sp.]